MFGTCTDKLILNELFKSLPKDWQGITDLCNRSELQCSNLTRQKHTYLTWVCFTNIQFQRDPTVPRRNITIFKMASMKLGFTFLLLAFVVLSAQAQSTEQIYNMWKNKALVNKQIKCVLRRGPCDVIGKVLTSKSIL